MNHLRILRGLLLALVASLTTFAPLAQADDTEIFVGGNNTASIQPNILFIFDNSGSMDGLISSQNVYTPATDFLAGTTCDASRVYYAASGNGAPNCSSANWVNLSAVVCQAALTAFTTAGKYTAAFARYDIASRSAGSRRWTSLSTGVPAHLVECSVDSGVHGLDAASAAKYAMDDTATTDTGYTTTAGNVIRWSRQTTYTLYSANYLAWLNTPAATPRSKISIVREVATSLLNSITGVNVGLMFFSSNNEGGMVSVPVEDIAINRATMLSTLAGLNAETNTPLSETMYEAGLYWRGQTWDYGSRSTKGGLSYLSAAGSRLTTDPTIYKTPIEYACQKNYIVYLTDGDPTADISANAKAATLIGGSCDTLGSVVPPDGICLDDLAAYYATKDLNSAIAGTQTAQTYTIGFNTPSQTLLQRTATRGGGKFYLANDTAGLAASFQSIVTEILDVNSTFSSPTVSVNAFNRTQNLNDIYVTVFRPALTALWPGNLKKYQIDPVTGDIEDAAGVPAVSPNTGFFADYARSFWSPAVDGAQAAQGGAASQLPSPALRKMYTYSSVSTSTLLTDASNAWSTTNPALTAAALGAASTTDATNAINWLRGADAFDIDGDGNFTEARLQMGDPLHARPATVIYGGTAGAPTATDAVVYVATNEGILQAIDAASGQELWSYVPDTSWQSVLTALSSVSTTNKLSTLDGSLQVLRIDLNFNGVIEPSLGDKVYLYFGQRRGGSNYFALDVTNKTAPSFLWKIGAAQLPGVGQTWSTPQVTQVEVAGSNQSTDQFVLLFGGGYEPDQDTATDGTTAYSTDSSGNAIYMVDAVSGSLLWRAGGAASGANLVLAKMNNAIPADLRVVDADGNGFAERLYATDMGGRVWRFDITSGNPAATLVAGGVFASLGNADEVSHPVASTRRFYYPPDVVLVRRAGQAPYVSLNIGSGHRASPLNTQVEDRFYALRDYGLFAQRTQAQYDTWSVVVDSALLDITTNVAPTIPVGAAGWKILLQHSGEKVLAESRTFANTIFFPTFTPSVDALAASCAPRQGTNRLFSMSLFDGSPLTNRDAPAGTLPTAADRERVLTQGGISPEAVFLFPTPAEGCVGAACRPLPQCLVGLEKCGIEFNNAPVKTYWRERQVTP